jgi:hypothetical protein
MGAQPAWGGVGGLGQAAYLGPRWFAAVVYLAISQERAPLHSPVVNRARSSTIAEFVSRSTFLSDDVTTNSVFL